MARTLIKGKTEWRLLIKSTDAQYAAVEAAIRELHSYELPAIYAVASNRRMRPTLSGFGRRTPARACA